MAVKYTCPKCGRRFTEWGAEKLGFKCPKDDNCPKEVYDDIELVRMGMSEDRAIKKPSLRKGARRMPAILSPSVMSEDEVLVPDIEDIEAATELDESIAGDEEFEAEADEEFEPVLAGPEIDVAVVEPDADVVEVADELAIEPDEVVEDIEESSEDEWTP
jgi:hypothetical protein